LKHYITSLLAFPKKN